jgi:hypothetical protein
MRYSSHLAVLLLATLTCACSEKRAESNVAAPGGEETTKTRLLEAGASALQDKVPLQSLDAYMNGFHFYNGNMAGQMEAHHFCGHLNEDVIQCVIYDGNGKNAKIMGVEYIVSARLFAGLPDSEKRLWHSHVHEVRSGQLIAPGIPEIAEHEFMEKIAGTYGKTWHTWHTDENLALPLGTPMLMMGFTADGQVSEQMVAERDQRFHVSSAEKRGKRADIAYPPTDPGADAWQKGDVAQLQLADSGKTAH